MLYTNLFTKTSKNVPADETSKNAQLLIRAGYIHKEMAGVYSFLPLGLRVLNNVMNVIRREMNAIGGQEIFMSTLQDPEIWKSSNRWIDNQDVDAWFTTKLKNDTELGLGFTHEEAITRIATNYVSSYRDLPFMAYQFQNKFRNETRAKSGIMRTREFIMKDLYSFAQDDTQHKEIYEKVKEAYVNIFKKLGIGEKTFVTFASGGVFSKYSHEFQTVCEAGEDEIYICDRLNLAINKEVLNDEVLKDLGIERSELRTEVASEVGNIFSLGTRFSDALNLKFNDESGEKKNVIMGSYGIGPARVMGVMTELLSDTKGLVWTSEVAPFQIHLVSLHKEEGDEVFNFAKEIYENLNKSHVEVLWDNRSGVGAGEKFADADLIGIPLRVLVSSKTIAEGNVEIKERKSENSELISKEQFLKSYTEDCK
jgi:prolyl-tRNA synthetase